MAEELSEPCLDASSHHELKCCQAVLDPMIAMLGRLDAWPARARSDLRRMQAFRDPVTGGPAQLWDLVISTSSRPL